jgi:alpha-tubulin suppressor-like RCC1 family protein
VLVERANIVYTAGQREGLTPAQGLQAMVASEGSGMGFAREHGRNPKGSLARSSRSTRRLLLVALTGALIASGLISTAAWASAARPDANKAPSVTVAPSNMVVEEGQTATFESKASGVPTPTVQWQISTNAGSTWSNVEGATSDLLTITDTKASENGYEFRAVFTNVAGKATSKEATLSVRRAPEVTQQPSGVSVKEGESAVFEAAAAGSPAPTVQWEVSTNEGGSWFQVGGATADRFTLAGAKASQNGWEYRATFTNSVGTASSDAATLTVYQAPVVTEQPRDQAVEEGNSAVFEATASGLPAPSVQWELSTNDGSTWSPVPGATSDQLTVADVTTPEDGHEYRAVFENLAGKVTSNAATLAVEDPPAVTEQPHGASVEEGESASFEASASGYPAPTVQWEISSNEGSTWSPVEGATADTLTIADTKLAESGDEYRALFTNIAGTATSEPAQLSVAPRDYLAFSWGQDLAGQLGDGTIAQSDTPQLVSDLSFVTSVSAGNRFSRALLSDGDVMAWGSNEADELGENASTMSDVPVVVEGLSDVKAIAAGSDFGLALRRNGTVMAWGGNESGQLGDGGVEESEVPAAVKGLSGVSAIAAGGEHSMALTDDGKVVSWGEGLHGELGDSKDKSSAVPVDVQGLTGVKAIAAGGEHSLAVLSDGTVKAWGADSSGQLGNSNVEEEDEEGERISEVPVAVEGLSGATAVAAGSRFSLALVTGGSVMAWGEDKSGQLGDGSVTRSEETPVAVSGLSGVTTIAAGGTHSLALLGDGAVMTWGEDKYGELGNGTAGEPSDLPVAVSGLNAATGIAAGGFHDLAFGEPVPTVTGVNPAVGPRTGETTVTVTGTGFSEASAVKFGTSNATDFTVNSSTSITAVSPAGSGTANVTVTAPAGTSPTVSGDRFTYLARPSVTKLSPKNGPIGGGKTVTITGKELLGASAVDFGSNPGRIIAVNSSTSMTVESPPGKAGTVVVTVTTAGGTSPSSSHAKYKYKK